MTASSTKPLAAPTLSALIRLLARLIPRDGSVVIPVSRPQIRDYQLPLARRDHDVESQYVGEIIELLLSLVEHRVRQRRQADGLLDVLGMPGGVTTATLLPPSARDRLWTLFEEAATMFAPEELTTISQRLMGLARLHHNYPEAAWALPTEETDRVARLAEQIAAAQPVPNDPVEANVWLFEDWDPRLGSGISPADDLVAYDQELGERRATAVGEVIRIEGLNGLRPPRSTRPSESQRCPGGCHRRRPRGYGVAGARRRHHKSTPAGRGHQNATARGPRSPRRWHNSVSG